ncbi:MFS transporter [Clostridium sp. D2Q-11]|uniref:MFS transporter n=1 Tax=Anaeromonas frigoriresistens TaxID=2683708 RepID=A0A942Z918_9FIRM|nr:MFS transporter [Anaeromonas frigoriresistens]MBS4538430.1 MFS transporter [Anaeromonas frigoriresistens]
MRVILSKIKNFSNFYSSISSNARSFLSIAFLTTFTMSSFDILLGIYLRDKGFLEAEVGGLISLRTLSMGIGSIPAALMSDALGRKKSITIAIFSIILGGLGMINVNNLLFMQVFSVIFGLGYAIIFVIEAPFVYENTTEKQRVSVFSLNFVLKNAGFMTGSLVSGYTSDFFKLFYSNQLSARLALAISTLLVLITLIPVYKISEDKKDKKEIKVFKVKDYVGILTPNIGLYVLHIAIIGLGAGMVVPFFSIYLKYTLQVSDGLVGTILSFAQFGTILGGSIVPILASKFGKVRTVLMCQLLSVPFLLSIAWPQGIVLIAISFFFRSSLMNMAHPIIQNLSMDLINERGRALISSMTSLTSNIFRALGIYLGGIMMTKYSYNAPYYFTILCYLIGSSVFYIIFQEKKKILPIIFRQKAAKR